MGRPGRGGDAIWTWTNSGLKDISVSCKEKMPIKEDQIAEDPQTLQVLWTL